MRTHERPLLEGHPGERVAILHRCYGISIAAYGRDLVDPSMAQGLHSCIRESVDLLQPRIGVQ